MRKTSTMVEQCHGLWLFMFLQQRHTDTHTRIHRHRHTVTQTHTHTNTHTHKATHTPASPMPERAAGCCYLASKLCVEEREQLCDVKPDGPAKRNTGVLPVVLVPLCQLLPCIVNLRAMYELNEELVLERKLLLTKNQGASHAPAVEKSAKEREREREGRKGGKRPAHWKRKEIVFGWGGRASRNKSRSKAKTTRNAKARQGHGNSKGKSSDRSISPVQHG